MADSSSTTPHPSNVFADPEILDGILQRAKPDGLEDYLVDLRVAVRVHRLSAAHFASEMKRNPVIFIEMMESLKESALFFNTLADFLDSAIAILRDSAKAADAKLIADMCPKGWGQRRGRTR